MNRTVINGLIIPVLIFTGFSTSAQSLTVQQIANLARSSTVFMEVSFHDPNNKENVCSQKSQGTGFVISQDGHVLSAYHVVEIPKVCREAGFTTTEMRGRIGYHQAGEWLPMRLTGRDDFSDVAVLKFSNRAEPYKNALMCQSRDLSPGTELVAIGFPHGTGYAPVKTSYSHSDSPEGDRWVAVSLFTFGMSGGPVYNLQGRVVGFIQGGRENTPAIRYIVPLRAARTMIDLAGVDLKRCTDDPVPDPECVAKEMQSLERPKSFESHEARVRCPGGGCLFTGNCNRRETILKYDAPGGYHIHEHNFWQTSANDAVTGTQAVARNPAGEIVSISMSLICDPPDFPGADGGWNSGKFTGILYPTESKKAELRERAKKTCTDR